MKKLAKIFMVPIIALVAFLPSADACTVCFGAKEDPITQAMSIAILFLVGVIFAVLLTVGCFFVGIHLKSKKSGDHAEGAASVGV